MKIKIVARFKPNQGQNPKVDIWDIKCPGGVMTERLRKVAMAVIEGVTGMDNTPETEHVVVVDIQVAQGAAASFI